MALAGMGPSAGRHRVRGLVLGGRIEMIATVRCAIVVLGFAAMAMCFASSAAAAPACSTPPAGGGDWPAYGHDVANTRTQPEEAGLGPAAVARLTPAWAFS